MSDDLRFRQAIAADKTNAHLYLIYADYLDEKGDPMADQWRE